ncbi:MAG: triose-phosphate isomerase [Alphaproteobacteria bacterium]
MRPLIAANWKMHGDVSWADKPAAFDKLLSAGDRKAIDVLICPPFPFITLLKNNACIHVGAQNCHTAVSGAHTGEVSAPMLAGVGASYIITGHSERRAAGETDADVKAKTQAVLDAGLTAILCVGESLKTRQSGDALACVDDQLAACLPDSLDNVVIAYEPIWAIGTGMTASLDDIAEMHSHIRGIVGAGTRILYGGSVKPANAKDILSTANVNGALIGGASLEMDSLAEIAKAAL